MNWLRTLRLWAGTWRAKARGVIKRLQSAYLRRTCPHDYRAALVKGEPGMVCRICDTSRVLTREEFYAQFGEKYWGMIGGER